MYVNPDVLTIFLIFLSLRLIEPCRRTHWRSAIVSGSLEKITASININSLQERSLQSTPELRVSVSVSFLTTRFSTPFAIPFQWLPPLEFETTESLWKRTYNLRVIRRNCEKRWSILSSCSCLFGLSSTSLCRARLVEEHRRSFDYYYSLIE